MRSQQKDSRILRPIHIDVTLDDINRKLQISALHHSDTLEATAKKILEQAGNLYHPRAIVRWLRLADVSDNKATLLLSEDRQVTFSMGCSSTFLQSAKHGMAGVYTIGYDLRTEGEKAAAERRYLDAHVYDLISLIALEKTGHFLNRIVENIAAKKGWQVGPLLSPGSVHGWDMAEQNLLCSLLPLSEIDVQIGESGVLRPFDTVSFLVGIGPDYTSLKVGSTCRICANKARCKMKQTMESEKKNG